MKDECTLSDEAIKKRNDMAKWRNKKNTKAGTEKEKVAETEVIDQQELITYVIT